MAVHTSWAKSCLILMVLWGTVGCLPASGSGDDEEQIVQIPSTDGSQSSDAMGAAADGGASDGAQSPTDGNQMMPASDGSTPTPAADMGQMADMGMPAPPINCEERGMIAQPFREGSGSVFGDVAGDFTLATLAGPWRFSERWTGCESYVFLNYFQDLRANGGGGWIGDQLWNSRLDELVEKGPTNVHYFFVSYEPEAMDRAARMEAMRTRVHQMIQQSASPEEVAHWRAHFHFVTDPLGQLDGALGAFVDSYMDYVFSEEGRVDLGDRGVAQPPLPFAFGIGRDQRFDSGGSLSPVVGQDSIWGMTAYFGHFYNHIGNLQEKVAAEEATVVSLLDEDVTDRVLTREAMLPDAAAMTGFDTMEFDIGVTCPHRNPFGCSEWDRIARISLCRTPTCNKRWEVVRWITPYWRRGHRRWLIDASPFLPLLEEGGAHEFYIEMGPSWERATPRHAKMSIRLSNRGTGRPIHIKRAYTGGDFGANYNASHEPYEVMAPDEATRAEMVVIVSGHEQTEQDNCAEWCDHRHQFSVNGAALPEITSMQRIGTLRGCAERADEGVSPGQWGNWAPGRAYWCPGLPVEAIRIDVTEQMMLGAMNEITYTASLGGEEPRGGNVDLSAYVVWYLD